MCQRYVMDSLSLRRLCPWDEAHLIDIFCKLSWPEPSESSRLQFDWQTMHTVMRWFPEGEANLYSHCWKATTALLAEVFIEFCLNSFVGGQKNLVFSADRLRKKISNWSCLMSIKCLLTIWKMVVIAVWLLTKEDQTLKWMLEAWLVKWCDEIHPVLHLDFVLLSPAEEMLFSVYSLHFCTGLQ